MYLDALRTAALRGCWRRIVAPLPVVGILQFSDSFYNRLGIHSQVDQHGSWRRSVRERLHWGHHGPDDHPSRRYPGCGLDLRWSPVSAVEVGGFAKGEGALSVLPGHR